MDVQKISPPRMMTSPQWGQSSGRRQSSANDEELDDGHGPDGAVLGDAEEILPDPVVHDVVSSAKYKRLFGALPLHRAVLDVFCRMAALGGRLMGDNIAETTRMTEQQMRSLAHEAQEFVVDYVDLIFGPAHTTKAHRLASHLLVALLSNGNLREGDTSENEALHGPCKRMYSRTNKRGPTIVPQMMRAAETQCEVLRELRQMTDDDVHVSGDDELFSLLEDVVPGEEVSMASPAALSRSHRGARIRVHDLEQAPGMSVLGSLLGEDADCSLFVSSSVSFYCTFEWGADTVVQTACATESYLGKARYDHIWYTDSSGQRRLGWARLIVRKLAGAVDDFVVGGVRRRCAHYPTAR